MPSSGDWIRLHAHNDCEVVYRRVNLLNYIAEYGFNLRDEFSGLHKLSDVFKNPQNPTRFGKNPVLDVKLSLFTDNNKQ